MFTTHMLFNEHWPQGYLVKRVLKLASSIVFLLVIAVPKKNTDWPDFEPKHWPFLTFPHGWTQKAGKDPPKTKTQQWRWELIIGSLSKQVFDRHPSTGSVFFSLLGSCYAQISRQIVSARVKRLSNTHMVVSRHIYREKVSLPVNVHPSTKSLLELSNRLI